MTTAINAYAFGNCTYYVATRYPRIYAYLGNAKDWITNAVKQNYPILHSPTPDTVVVYGPGNGYSSLGHVAVVDAVNADGSFQVSEMNYRGYDVVDQRRSTMKGVIGFIVPPGSSYVPKAAAAVATANSKGSCIHTVHVPGLVPGADGVDVCLDGPIGFSAMAAGGLVMLAGVGVFVAFSLKNSGMGDKIGSLIPLAGGPYGKAISLAMASSPSKPKPSESMPSEPEQKKASEERVAKAKARLDTPPVAEAKTTKAPKSYPPMEGYGAQKEREERSDAA